MKLAWICLIGFTLAVPGALSENGGKRMITLKEARKLAHLALSEETAKLPGLTLTPSPCDKAPCRCTTFDVLWSNRNGSPHCCFYAVDMRTGEVWQPMLCERVKNPALESAQRAIRKRLGVTEAEYQEALKPPPRDCCLNPDVYIKQSP